MTFEKIDEKEDTYKALDRMFQANLSHYTFGMTPAGFTKAYVSWLSQLMISPGRMMNLSNFAFENLAKTADEIKNPEPPKIADARFKDPKWQEYPWRLYLQNYHFAEDYVRLATKDVSGLSPRDERVISFMFRQMLDMVSPYNFLPTNPELIQKTIDDKAQNLFKGAKFALEDMNKSAKNVELAGFKIGENIAASKGKVIFQNHLIELIQYSPTTEKIAKEPILVIPAWIMKYYVLDLSAHNSMVKYLVDQGHNVFMISWRNPDAQDFQYGMDEYVKDGAMAAIDAVSSICNDAKINLVGYCLGGTLSMIIAAMMAHDKDTRLNSLTLFAAQADFTEAGEIMLFVNHSQIEFLKNMMASQGYLDTKQMAGAFEMLRSYDLVWSRMVHEYLMGERAKANDIMAWNADPTRMPYKMHSEYLERLFLNNEFAEGNYSVLGKPIAPENIKIPIFVVGTEKDHIAPWKSVYKIHLLANSDVTFALTNGGHNAGIVSEPGHKNRHYYINTHKHNETYQSPQEWLEKANYHDGSWWPAWNSWLGGLNSKTQIGAPKQLGNRKFAPIHDAPGEYILQR